MSAGSAAFIRCENAAYRYRAGNRALERIDLEIGEGEFVAVVGHNGSGKSTLAMLLSGLEKPSEGNVFIAGINTRENAKGPELRKQCGIVFQNPENQLVFEKTADDIAFGPKNLGFAEAEIDARVAEVSKMLGIENFSGSFELSMGQKQRVAIAGVLAMKPRCVVFDEPTAMLDPKGKKEIHGIIVDLHRAGITVVYITNVIDEVLSAGRIVVLDQGRVACEFRHEDLAANLDRLRALGLETPLVLEAADRLRRAGLPVEMKDYSLDALVEGITALCEKRASPEAGARSAS